MNRVTTAQDIKRLGTIVTVWAHPDDESFTCGGLLAAAARNGQTVVVITATRGEAGIQDPEQWPPERLGEIRTRELKQALKILGIEHHYWLSYRDGYCQQAVDERVVGQLIEIVKRHQPDTILTFGPDGLTGHPDHRAVSAWTDQLVNQLDKQPELYHLVELAENFPHIKPLYWRHQIFFKTDKPPLRRAEQCDICYCLSPEELRLKARALAAMPSQYQKMLASLSDEVLETVLGTEALVLK